jgi:hypothetical protein
MYLKLRKCSCIRYNDHDDATLGEGYQVSFFVLIIVELKRNAFLNDVIPLFYLGPNPIASSVTFYNHGNFKRIVLRMH